MLQERTLVNPVCRTWNLRLPSLRFIRYFLHKYFKANSIVSSIICLNTWIIHYSIKKKCHFRTRTNKIITFHQNHFSFRHLHIGFKSEIIINKILSFLYSCESKCLFIYKPKKRSKFHYQRAFFLLSSAFY